MMTDYLESVLSLSLTSAAAWFWLEFMDRGRVLSALEKLPLAYMLGLGMTAWEMLALQLMGIHFNVLRILMPVLASSLFVGMVCVWRKTPLGIDSQTRSRRISLRWSKLDIFLLSGILLELGLAFVRALLQPMEAFDAVSNWGLKSKAIYLAGTIPSTFFRNREYLIAHMDYPLLLPLVESYVYFFLGHLNDFAVKWIFPLSLAACVTSLYICLRRFALDRTACLAFAFVLVSIPHFVFNATTGYADIIIASYFGMGFFYLFAWIQERNDVFLWISAMLTGMAGMTKNEGMVLCVINWLVLVLAVQARKPADSSDSWRRVVSYGGILIAVLLPWLVFRQTIEVQNDLVRGLDLKRFFQWETLRRAKPIFYYYQAHLFNVKNWNLLWLAAFLLLLFRFRRIIQTDQRYILLAIVFTFSVYTLVYFVTYNDVAWHLKTSVSRLMIHFVPLVVFGFACVYQDLEQLG